MSSGTGKTIGKVAMYVNCIMYSSLASKMSSHRYDNEIFIGFCQSVSHGETITKIWMLKFSSMPFTTNLEAITG